MQLESHLHTPRMMDLDYPTSNYSVESLGPGELGGFDFTPLFEDAFLSILPSAVLLLLLPLRMFALHQKPRKVLKTTLQSRKLIFLMVLTSMQTILLVLYTFQYRLRTRATLAAACLSTAGALGLCFLSHMEHIYSLRPSALINVYLLLSLVFDIARSRTIWLHGSNQSVAAVFTSTVAVKFTVLVTEAIEKRAILLDRYKLVSPEQTSGIYSKSLFWWLNSLMKTGFQRVLTDQDLYLVDLDMASSILQHNAQKKWKSASQSQQRALLWSTLSASKAAFAYCIFPRICLIAFRYAQPFLLSRTVRFANSPTEPDSIGWGLTAAIFLVFLGLAVANANYYHMVYRFVTSVRGILITQIYARTVDLSITALNESAAVTLMSSDTETICRGFANIHELWAVPVELGIALWLLYRQLGLAFLAPAVVSFISTATILAMAKYIGNAQKVWIQGIQTRVGVTASMLGSMKAIKMLGFTGKVSDIIQALRVTELKLSTLFRKLLCIRVFFATSTVTYAPYATFVVFVIVAKFTGKQLGTSSAFTALSLISLLGTPMSVLVSTIPMINSSMACFDRIQRFLNSDARKDHRLPLYNPASSDTEILVESVALTDISPRFLPATSPHRILVIQNASFGWTSDERPIVSDVTFTLSRHQFCFIVGPVGSGKSTLLKGLLSETPSSQGFVYSSNPSIGYVDQTPWIQNGTVQQNILGISSFEEPWYSQVVHACALDFDISNMPNGHATRVGSAGISLSGGQKQRLALARAVYAKKELLLLDDVFSGLDAETEEQVFERFFGANGLLHAIGSTVLLVTHAIQRLPYSSQIIALDASGHVSEQGTFEELSLSGGYVQGLAINIKSEISLEKPLEVKKVTVERIFLKENLKASEPREDELNRQTGDFAVYKYYFASIGWRLTLAWTILTILNGVAGKLTEFLITRWTSAVASHGNSVNGFYIGLYGMLAGISTAGLIGGAFILLICMVPRSAEVLHEKLLRTVMGAPVSFLTSTDVGTTTNRFSQDMTVIDAELPFALVDLAVSVVRALMGAILMCLSAGYFAVTIPPVIFVVWVLQKYYLRTSRQMRLLDLEAKSPLYSHFIESLQGLVTIRAFGWAEEFNRKNSSILDVSQKPYYLLFCIQRWLALVLDLLVTALAVILMVLVVKLRSTISGGFVGLALLNVISFNESLANIIKSWTALETSLGAIARLKSFASQTTSEDLPAEIAAVSQDWPASGSIIFKNVSASYQAGSDLAVKNIDLNVQPGEKLGVCGRSGSGKSSLVSTLFCMLDVREGTIIIDGIDISTIPKRLVRERLNALPQDPFFMRGSVRMNADPYSVHSDADIISAVQKVHLWELVHSKGGLEADLDATFFSHGQRQLFCLARAILRSSKIVVLDEATSSVDATSDGLMQQVIREELGDCTIIAVAHRLNTIMDFDRIALLSGGELKELDAPMNLLKGPSAFRDLYYS